MDFLNCYKLVDENVVSGITVNDFESIIVEDNKTTLLKKAVLQMIPVMEPELKDNLNSVSETSLTFIREPGKKDTESKDYIVVEVNPSEWKLCYDRDVFGILDPCGTNGNIILLLHKGTKHALVKANNNRVVFGVSDENKPVVSTVNRAALLLESVVHNDLMKMASKLPSQVLLAAPKTSPKSRRS